ncbi:MAG: hypothetical protein PHV79_01005 [Clostridia bacterium]|nr:hypothetical protein [Clostridia bacterium]MDD3862422.1 hypothetical protein [Clostridia bacterium]
MDEFIDARKFLPIINVKIMVVIIIDNLFMCGDYGEIMSGDGNDLE